MDTTSKIMGTREAAEKLGLKSASRIQQICIAQGIGRKLMGRWILTPGDLRRISKFTRKSKNPRNVD